eukprot:CAMPEP_0114676958 /NCGR_PEP_ID=MMETSP0191-20121206/49921_1 /TAXON_ID=126664 /ORGANISM="Sorites sp." /LENGTH=49 /DNA_ID=CAMNT_0001948807 /DNA_START=200 /DNA_END=349 /DNA_ORIENTATION=+
MISKHINILRAPLRSGVPQKPPSATYLASRAKYVPEPQSVVLRLPDAKG